MSAKLVELNDATIDAIAKAVLLGMPPKHAAINLGIPDTTFRRWSEIGDAEVAGNHDNAKWRAATPRMRKLCGKLATELGKAKTSLMKRTLASLLQKSQNGGPWQIDAWLLERLYPQYFANRVDIHARIKKGADKATINELMARMAAKATDESD